MRWIAIGLLICFLAAVGLTGYLYLNANVRITGIDCVAADAADQPGVMEALKAQMTAGTFVGTPFETGEIGEPSGYQFYTYTVHLENGTFMKAEAVEVQVTPMNGDVLQMPENGMTVIPARTAGSAQATILTDREMHNVREILVTYYLWGMPFSIRTTYNR